MAKILKYTTNTLLYGFALITIVLLFLLSIGIKPYITVSGSMEPNIKTGSICFVNTKENYSDIKTDDVIAFKAGNTLVTHRVHNITNNGIETKGDNNEKPDSIVTNNDNFVGKTLFSIPYIGYIIMFFKTPVGLYSIFVIILLLVALNIKDFLKIRRKV